MHSLVARSAAKQLLDLALDSGVVTGLVRRSRLLHHRFARVANSNITA